jgi:hypothetical protein
MGIVGLSGKQLKAIALLVYSDKTNKEVAKIVKVTEQTFYNWMLVPEFKAALMSEKIQYLETITANTVKPFTDLIIATYETMMQIMRSGSFDERMKVFELIWNDVKNDSIASMMLASVKGLGEKKVDITEEMILERDRRNDDHNVN